MADPADEARGARRASPSACETPDEPDVDWAEVRRLYEAGEMRVWAIRADFGLTVNTLRWRRERERWRPRPSAAVRRLAQEPPATTPDEIGERLAALIGVEVERLKRRLSHKQLDQKDARLLVELARAVTQMSSNDRAKENAARRAQARPEAAIEKKNKNNVARFGTDIAELRAELERRLERLSPAEGLEGTPEGGAG